MESDIIIITPVAGEGAYIDPANGVRIVVGGVGMAAISATLSRLLCGPKPDMVILAGIAGACPGDGGLQVGDVVLVAEERVADLGAMRGGGFEPLFTEVYRCPYLAGFPDFRAVAGNTVNCAAAAGVPPADIENMEGAAFFAICLEQGVPFLEVRAVSNVVGAPRDRWNIPLATQNLATAINKLLTVARRM